VAACHVVQCYVAKSAVLWMCICTSKAGHSSQHNITQCGKNKFTSVQQAKLFVYKIILIFILPILGIIYITGMLPQYPASTTKLIYDWF